MFGRHLVGAALVLALLTPVGWAQAQGSLPPFMPLAEIKPGMRGIGRTVIQGQKIEEFTIEVIGILKGGGGIIPVKHLVLFRTSGSVIDRSGGTAAGMSGSPLFIGGKLIGALSAGYLFQPEKRDLALATPIEEMLRVLDLPPGSPGSLWPRTFVANRPIWIGDRLINKVVIAGDFTQAERVNTARIPGVIAFTPATFPAAVSGLTARAQRIVERVLGLRQPLLQYLGASTGFKVAPITGGSSVGILQVRGDIDFGGICTVTLRVGTKLLICGHPWDLLGDVVYALTASEVITVVRTLEQPFKEANLGDVIGTIDQDRGPAIRGILGKMPRMFPVRVKVTDLDKNSTISKAMQVVPRADLAKLFTLVMTLTAIDLARDQTLGGGTAEVKITLRGKGLSRALARENTFYSSRDIALASLLDLPDALNFFFYNDFIAIDPVDIRIEVGLTAKRNTAAIANISVDRRELSPGETLKVRLTLRPFRGQAQSQVIDVAIPKDFPRGQAVLKVSPAGTQIPIEFSPEERMVQFLLKEPEPIPADTLEEAIEFFEDAGKNTDVLIQVVPSNTQANGAKSVKVDVSVEELVKTNWVLQGSVEIPIFIR